MRDARANGARLELFPQRCAPEDHCGESDVGFASLIQASFSLPSMICLLSPCSLACMALNTFRGERQMHRVAKQAGSMHRIAP